jgi:hypothetical protein
MRKKYLPATVTLPEQHLQLRQGGYRLLLLGSVSAHEADRPSQWAMREMEEVNNWARLGAKLYFCWFTLVLVFNGLGMSWLFTRDGVIPDYANVIFVVFLMLNLASLAAVYFTRSYMLAAGTRMADMLKAVTRQNGGGGYGMDVQSPMPALAVNTAYYFSLATLTMLMFFWVYLMGWGMAAIARSAKQPPAPAALSVAPTPSPTPTSTPTPTPTPPPTPTAPS